jgi:glutamate carboxypeptidase
MRRLFVIAVMAPAITLQAGKKMNSVETKIAREAQAGVPRALELLAKSVDIPSGTLNLEGVRRVGELFATELRELGFETRWAELPAEVGRAGHLIAEHHGKGPRILMIGHLDTVLEGSKWRREGDVAYGSGASDMKGGDVIIIAAMRALRDAGALKDANVVIVMTGDEEDAGWPREVSRRDLIELGKTSRYALGFENTVGDTATVARRGTSSWTLTVSSKTGHSSHIFQEDVGTGAIFEAARILNAMYERLHTEQYLTFNPSVIVGGTKADFDSVRDSGTASGKTNVVPATVIVDGDLRFISLEQRDKARKVMEEIAAGSLAGTSAKLEFRGGYPAMSPVEANYAILSVLDSVSRDLGFPAVTALDPGVRGAGDIAFVAPFVASLDGLGAKGFEEHAAGEHIDLTALPMLIQRAALLVHRLSHAPH